MGPLQPTDKVTEEDLIRSFSATFSVFVISLHPPRGHEDENINLSNARWGKKKKLRHECLLIVKLPSFLVGARNTVTGWVFCT